MHFLSASLVVTWALSLISCMVICQGSFHSSVRYNMKPYPCPPLLFIGNISIGMTLSLLMETCQQRQHKKKTFIKKIMSIVFCHHCGLILSTAHNQCVGFQRQTLETRRELGRVNFRKDFWHFWEKEKIDQWLTGASPITIPETEAGHISAPVSFYSLLGSECIDLYFAWHKRNLCGAENFFTHKEVRKQTINASKSYILCHSTSILKESRQCLFKYQKYHLEKPHNAIHNFH